MAERYLELSSKYLSEGWRFLKEGDLQQASDKFWGAAAEAIKALAEVRGWPHHRYRQLMEVLSRLFAETKDEELLKLRAMAEALHSNFYEEYMGREEVEVHAKAVERLVEKLKALAFQASGKGSSR